ncbi:MAG: DUF2281 domain-containing protein [Bacteroidota bacterium]
MNVHLNLQFEQLLHLINQLSQAEKERLLTVLQNNIVLGKSNQSKRQLGKYQGKIIMSDDFNSPLDDFQEYM